MKSRTEYLWFNTRERVEFVNITGDCERILAESGIKEGFMLVSAMHITASIWVNDNEPGIWKDAQDFLAALVPHDKSYLHHRTGEDNADAHLKNLLVGHQELLPITNGKFDLGPWQQVFYCEFDGGRRKRVIVKAIGD